MTDPFPAPAAPLTSDGRQSEAAAAICRGTSRLLWSLGLPALPELVLPTGRRADLTAVGAKGEIWIVEIKSSVADFRSDAKWPEYRDFCDRLLFAVDRQFPADLLPLDTGLIIADRYGADLVRDAPLHMLSPARRKALTLRIARVAAARMQAAADPEHGLEIGRIE